MALIKTYQPVLDGSPGPIFANPNDALQDIIHAVGEDIGIVLNDEETERFCMLIVDGLDITRFDVGEHDMFNVHKLRVAMLEEDYVNNLPEHSGY